MTHLFFHRKIYFIKLFKYPILSSVVIETFFETTSEQVFVALGSISTVKTLEPFPLN